MKRRPCPQGQDRLSGVATTPKIIILNPQNHLDGDETLRTSSDPTTSRTARIRGFRHDRDHSAPAPDDQIGAVRISETSDEPRARQAAFQRAHEALVAARQVAVRRLYQLGRAGRS
jgi:hypothetical protein